MPVFAQDAAASEKIQLLSEALYARDAGDLLLAKEKVDKLVAIAPRDKNVQALLVSINESIEEEGLHLINNEQEEAAEVEEETIVASEASGSLLKLVKNDVSGKKLLPAHEVSPGYLEQKENVKDLMLVANSQIAIGDLAGIYLP